MKKAGNTIKPIILGLVFILSYVFFLIGIGMEEFFEIAGNALTL